MFDRNTISSDDMKMYFPMGIRISGVYNFRSDFTVRQKKPHKQLTTPSFAPNTRQRHKQSPEMEKVKFKLDLMGKILLSTKMKLIRTLSIVTNAIDGFALPHFQLKKPGADNVLTIKNH